MFVGCILRDGITVIFWKINAKPRVVSSVKLYYSTVFIIIFIKKYRNIPEYIHKERYSTHAVFYIVNLCKLLI